MHLSFRKKIFLFTVIPVSLIYNVLFVVLQFRSLNAEHGYLERDLIQTTSLVASKLDLRFRDAYQLGERIDQRLQTVTPTQRDPEKLAHTILNAADIPCGSIIAFIDKNDKLSLIFGKGGQISWERHGQDDSDAFKKWLRESVGGEHKRSVFYQPVTITGERLTRHGFLNGIDTTVAGRQGVVLTFVPMDDFMVGRSVLMAMNAYLFLLDGSGQPLFPLTSEYDDVSQKEIYNNFAKANSPLSSQDNDWRSQIFHNDAVLRHQQPVGDGQLILAGVLSISDKYGFLADLLPLTVTFISTQILVFLLFWLFTGQITSSIKAIGQAMDRIAEGKLDAAAVDFKQQHDVLELGKRFADMTEQLVQREGQQRQTMTLSFDRLLSMLGAGFFYISHDLNGHLTYVSPWVAEALSTKGHKQKMLYTDLYANPSKKRRAQEVTDNLMRNGGMGVYEVEMELAGGDRWHFEIVKMPMYDASGKIVGAEGLGRNITRWVSDLDHFKGLLHYAPDAMVITNASGVIVMVNSRTETLLALQGNQLIGKNVCSMICPEDRDRFAFLESGGQDWQSSVTGASMEVSLCRADGEVVPVDLTMNAIDTPNGLNFSLFMRDVSQRRLAELALHASEERYRRTISALQQEYIFYSQRTDGTYINVTPSVEHILGYAPEFFMKNWHKAPRRRSDWELRNQVFQKLCRGESHPSYQMEMVKADGSIAILEVFESPAFNAKGEVIAIEGLAHDRTREYRAATALAEAANEAKTQFLSNMSHELRTPLNGVLGYTQLLMVQGNINARQHSQLQSIQTCGQHLLHLINDILDLTKAESGHLSITAQPFNLPELIDSVRQIVCLKAEAKGLKLEITSEPNVPAHIIGDDIKIRQVLLNLIDNAIKFTDTGRVILEITRHNGQLLFTVIDSGMGIVEEQIKSIFSPFRQGTGGLRRGGTGLGLAISQRIANAMGGALEVTSELNVGSRFMFTIPLKRAAEPEKSGRREISFVVRPGSGKGASGTETPTRARHTSPKLSPELVTRLSEQFTAYLDIGDVEGVRALIYRLQKDEFGPLDDAGQWFDTVLKYCDDLDIDGLSQIVASMQQTVQTSERCH